jgi:hypothetical protein
MAIISSCTSSEDHAINSLVGEWEIDRIVSDYGNFNNSTNGSEETIIDSGDLGMITFTESSYD